MNSLNIGQLKQCYDSLSADQRRDILEVLPKIEKLLERVQRRNKHPNEDQRKIVQILTVLRAELSTHIGRKEDSVIPLLDEVFGLDDIKNYPAEKASLLADLVSVLNGEYEGICVLIDQAMIYAEILAEQENKDFINMANV